jgi:Leucine-rich repeat (LRR) protein
MPSIKELIIEKNEGEEVEFSEYTNLIMDEMEIEAGKISPDDKTFLESFTECQFLSLNKTGLKSLENLPKLPKLERLELTHNEITGSDVASIITDLYPNLVTLKLTGNKISEVNHIEAFKGLSKLESLDLTENPFCEKVSTECEGDVKKY